MAKIYVSSTIADLQAERRAVMDWIVAAGHQPVHSYRPDSETVRESCLQDVGGCGLYVLILGHRYGTQPEPDNPEKLSITQLEFRRAGESRIPRIALLRMSVPDIALTDLLDPARAALVSRFEREVRDAVRPFEFRDREGLIAGLSTGVLKELAHEPDDREVQSIVATLTRVINEKDAENLTLPGRVRELEEQLHAAVYRTLKAAGQPDASGAAIAAAQALGAGDTRPAEALLGREEGEQAGQIGAPGVDDASQRSQAAALAREQGALAMGHDVGAALAAFQRAAEYQPEDTWTHFFIGDLHVLLGDLEAAMRSFQRGQALAAGLAARDPANTGWQRDLSISHDRIGNMLVAQDDGPGALAAYRKALGIREALAARDPANTQWQRDLSISHEKIGDVLVAQGDGPGALAAYRKALGIAEALAASDPANTGWQRDLSISHDRIGDVLVAQGDGAGALAAYRKSLGIREALAARDPANAQWQTDLAVSCSKLGALEYGQTIDGRREHLRRGRAILARLKEQGRLHPQQDWIQWFDDQLAGLVG